MRVAAVTASAQDRDQEAALGARLADEIRLQSRPIESAVVRACADGICQKLAAKLPDPGVPYSLELVSGWGYWTLSQEPLVLPGGYIFVRADQIQAVQSEAEFVGLLAHAMAHVAGRHFTQREPGQIVRLTAAQDRGRFEFEADLLAIQTARDAGYDHRVGPLSGSAAACAGYRFIRVRSPSSRGASGCVGKRDSGFSRADLRIARSGRVRALSGGGASRGAC